VVATTDGNLWHTIYHANGTWQAFDNVKAAVGGSSIGPATKVAVAAVNGELHLAVVTNDYGSLWHTIRHTDGTWQNWGNVKAAVGGSGIGLVFSISVAAVNGELHLVVVTADNYLWHTIRHTDGTWQNWGDVNAAVGGRPLSLTDLQPTATSVDGELHLAAIAFHNEITLRSTTPYAALGLAEVEPPSLWGYTIRHANGSWQQIFQIPVTGIPGPPLRLQDLAIAGFD
jgi:hypothetical protein